MTGSGMRPLLPLCGEQSQLALRLNFKLAERDKYVRRKEKLKLYARARCVG